MASRPEKAERPPYPRPQEEVSRPQSTSRKQTTKQDQIFESTNEKYPVERSPEGEPERSATPNRKAVEDSSNLQPPASPSKRQWQDALLLLEKGASSLKQTLEEHTVSLDEQKAEIAKLKKDYSELQGKLGRRDRKVKELEEEKEKLVGRIEALEQETESESTSEDEKQLDRVKEKLQTLPAGAEEGKTIEPIQQSTDIPNTLNGNLIESKRGLETAAKPWEGPERGIVQRIEKLESPPELEEPNIRQQNDNTLSLSEQVQKVPQCDGDLEKPVEAFEKSDTQPPNSNPTVDYLNEQMRKLETKNTELENRVKQQNTELYQLAEQTKKDAIAIDSSRSASAEVRSNSQKLHTLKAEKAILEKRSLAFQEQIQHQKDEEKRLVKELSAEQDKTRDLKNQLSQLTENYRVEIEKEKANLKAQIVSDQLTEKNKEIKELEETLENHQSRIKDLREELTGSTGANATIKKQLDDLQRAHEDLINARDLAKIEQSLSKSEQEKKLGDEIDELKSERKRKVRQLDDLKDRLQELMETQNSNKKTIRERNQEVKDANERLQEQKIKIDELETEQTILQSNLDKAQEDNKRLSAAQIRDRTGTEQLRELQKQVNEKNGEISDQKAKIDRMENRLIDIQGFAFELRKIAAQNTTDDSIIRSRLQYEFRDGTRSWAKHWAVRSFDGNLGRFGLGELGSEFQKVAVVTKEISLQKQLQNVDPRVMVDALLSYYLVDRIFRDSYLQHTAKQSEGESASMEVGLSKVLIEFYKIFKNADEDEANRWRTQTVHLLESSKSITPEGSPVQQLKDDDLHKLAEDFLSGPAQVFLQPLPESDRTIRKKQLVQVIKETSNLAIYINQNQGAMPQFQGIESCQGRRFRHDSLFMEADRSHHMELDDDTRDGVGIRMVVKPGFFVSEQGDAEPKVWGKTVVLLSDV